MSLHPEFIAPAPVMSPRKTAAAIDLDAWRRSTPGEHVVPLLFAALYDAICNPELADAARCLEAIYEHGGPAHYEAAAEAEKACRDICDAHFITP